MVDIEVEGDEIKSKAPSNSPLKSGLKGPYVFDTYEDHRMAMAFAPVCLRTGSIRICNPEVVSKSYPAFWEDLKKVGFGTSNPL